jgi:ABC-2 type transport system permease protein
MEKLSIRRIKALVVKEFLQIKKDPSSLLISGFLPILLLFLYGYGISFDLKHIKIGVVLEDSSPLATSFVDCLKFSNYFDPLISRNKEVIQHELAKGAVKGFVVIPSYFSTFFYDQHRTAPLQVVTDGSEPNTAILLQNYIKGAFLIWKKQIALSKGELIAEGIELESRVWYNPSLDSRNYLIPGSLAIILTLIGTLLTSLVIAREWERGTMESLIATPVKMKEFILSKLISYFVLGIFAFLLSVLLAKIVYEVPLKGSIILLSIVGGTFLLSALGMGLMISTLFRNQFAASQAAIVSAFLPSFFLSGFIYEVASMPKIIQLFSSLISAKYFVSSLQTLFLVGVVGKLIFLNLTMMLIIGILFLIIASKKTLKRLD